MKKNRNWLIIAVLAFALAASWAITSAAANIRRSTIPADVEKIMTPLSPTINQDIFTTLSKKEP
ncbi:hypothetical protein M1403_02390 [Patescibacteria group bacterium]|nr:hypothetical protein [Patescibacteria group bacterium]